jgi:hypothetical protein
MSRLIMADSITGGAIFVPKAKETEKTSGERKAPGVYFREGGIRALPDGDANPQNQKGLWDQGK